MTSILRTGPAARLGAILLLAGPVTSWIAEFITAAAWQHPPYAPLYNWVSLLGVPGPSHVAFKQVANSPLAWVMNTGWIFYGTVLIIGTALLLDLRAGARPVCLFALAVISGIGVCLVGIFHGSEQNVENGLIAFHTLGAQGVIIAGNVFALLAGRFGPHLGIPARLARTLIILGIVGLAGFVVFMADYVTGIQWDIGLFERSAIYPIMIGHTRFARALLRTPPSGRLSRRGTAAMSNADNTVVPKGCM